MDFHGPKCFSCYHQILSSANVNRGKIQTAALFRALKKYPKTRLGLLPPKFFLAKKLGHRKKYQTAVRNLLAAPYCCYICSHENFLSQEVRAWNNRLLLKIRWLLLTSATQNSSSKMHSKMLLWISSLVPKNFRVKNFCVFQQWTTPCVFHSLPSKIFLSKRPQSSSPKLHTQKWNFLGVFIVVFPP